MKYKSYTPLRYPGGKTCLYDTIKNIVYENQLNNKIYVEPYSGGFGLGLKLMLNNDMEQFVINDYDYHIYAFWKCVFLHTKQLIEKIVDTEITIKEWHKQKQIYNDYKKYTILEVGFSTLFLNRTNYSGILKSGPIGGFNQTGKYKINCRFNKDKLIEIIRSISKFKKNVKIYNYDAIELIKKLQPVEKDIFYNFDPPYVKKGKELYLNAYNQNDHINLQKAVSNIGTKWVMTYDDTDFIRNLYRESLFTMKILSYSAGSKRKANELFISNFYSEKQINN